MQVILYLEDNFLYSLVDDQNITDDHTSQPDLQLCQMPVGVIVKVLARNGAIANLGQSYSLSCTVRGIDCLNCYITYQWFKDQSLLPGEMASTLYFSALTLSDTGNYSCEAYIRSAQQGHGTIIASSSHSLNFPSELVTNVILHVLYA